jgi:diguanylate cyclase (GGDEF)-like protein
MTGRLRPPAAVWNRESILELLAREFERATHERRGLSILLVGIDQLQQLSLEHGQSCAESVAAEVAKRLTRPLRSYDHVGRYAAEQFLVLPLSYQDTGEIRSLGQTLCDVIAREPLDVQSKRLPVTVSVGAAAVTEGEPGQYEILRRLEMALYRAQAAGGNRVEMASPARSALRATIPTRDELPVRLLVTIALLACVGVALLVRPGLSCAPFRVADILSSEELSPPLPVDCAATTEKPSDSIMQDLDKQREDHGLLLQETVTCKVSLSAGSHAARLRDQQWLSSLYVNGTYQYRRHVFLTSSEDVPGGRIYTVEVCLLPWWTYLIQPSEACWDRYAFWR